MAFQDPLHILQALTISLTQCYEELPVRSVTVATLHIGSYFRSTLLEFRVLFVCNIFNNNFICHFMWM